MTAWRTRLQLEEQALASKGSSQQQQLLELLQQALQQVPPGEAEQLWQQAFDLAAAASASSPAADGTTSSGSGGGGAKQLASLQQMLTGAITRGCAQGPPSGGLGAVAGSCLRATWAAQGAAAARQLWQRLLLLPPAGGDMFRAMIALETAAAPQQQQDGSVAKQPGSGQQQAQQQQRLPADAVKRARAVYEAWAGAYGGRDAALWVEYAAFEQQQSRAGAGKVYWRAVKALPAPEEFIAEYRQRVGLA